MRAAAIPAQLFGDIDGAHVYDLCAAPGGKTLQLAGHGARVNALDRSANRLKRLRENLERMRLLEHVEVEAVDAQSWKPKEPASYILLDAPCSATGTLRRHPDLPYVRPSLDLKPLLDLQQAMLRRAVGWLKPGGRLVYATCSLIPAEGERQMARFLENGGAALGSLDAKALGLSPDWLISSGEVRLRPDYWAERGGMDGFYMGLIHKT